MCCRISEGQKAFSQRQRGERKLSAISKSHPLVLLATFPRLARGLRLCFFVEKRGDAVLSGPASTNSPKKGREWADGGAHLACLLFLIAREKSRERERWRKRRKRSRHAPHHGWLFLGNPGAASGRQCRFPLVRSQSRPGSEGLWAKTAGGKKRRLFFFFIAARRRRRRRRFFQSERSFLGALTFFPSRCPVETIPPSLQQSDKGAADAG